MTVVYLAAFAIIVAILFLRLSAASRSDGSRMTWLALVFASFAMLTLGIVIPIEILDALLGGGNAVWLAQCILATFAFWAFSAAATSVGASTPITLRSLGVPVMWCLGFAIAFFLNTDRGETTAHFSRETVANTWTFLSALIYLVGISWMASRIIAVSWGQRAPGHRLFVIGSGCVIIGCACYTIVMVLARAGLWGVDSDSPLYSSFDILFYPGIVLIAIGMGAFNIRRRRRLNDTRHRGDKLRGILRDHGIRSSAAQEKTNDTYAVYALLVCITDHRNLGDLVLTEEETRIVEEAETWVEGDLPHMLEAAG